MLDYIQEVKPYHVQVKQFNLIYNGFNEWFGDMTDFDLPAYYNTAIANPGYTSPILLPYNHATFQPFNIESDVYSDNPIWSKWPYSQWFANYTLEFFTEKPKSVLDIACNDGSQLNAFKAKGFKT